MSFEQKIWQKEWWQMSRFVVVMAMAYGIYAVVYVCFSRILFPHANLTLLTVIAACFGDAFNFFANRSWTFRAHAGSYKRQAFRFVIVIASSLGLQTLFFWLGTNVLSINDLLLALVLPAFRAMFNYVFHRNFTFREISK